MFRFRTKEDMLNSPDIRIRLVYLAPESGGDLKMWRVLEGVTPGSTESEPKKGDIENMLETCNGITNAFVQNISGSFKSRGVLNGSVDDFYEEAGDKIPYCTIHFNTEVDQWLINDAGFWYSLDVINL